MQKNMNIPVFPLSVFLLPQGITRLKIFEQRYLNMVKIATKENGFAILHNTEGTVENCIASWVDIINFDKSDDGILQIDVKCKSLITLTEPYVDKERLMWATIDNSSHWQDEPHDDITLKLGELLQSLFEENEDLFTLYNNHFINKPNWILARWLELLPIKTDDKAHFLLPNSYLKANSFLSNILIVKN
jgi:Lon protease-like protein